MIRALAGFAVAWLCLLPLGIAILRLSGTWDRLSLGLRVALPGFAGMAGAAIVLPALLYIGLSPSVPIVLLAGVVALAVSAVAGRSSRGRRLHLDPHALVLVPPLVLLALQAIEKPVHGYDAFANWALKAKLLSSGGVFTGALTDAAFADLSVAPPVSRQFPIGLPALEAYFVRDLGGTDLRVGNLLFVLLLAGFSVTAWALLRAHVDRWALAAGMSFVLWMPAVREQALSAYADVPLACFWVPAVLAFGLWVADEGDDLLVLGAVFAASALAIKRDAIAFTAILFALTLAAVLVRREVRRPRVGALVIAALAVAATTIPWRVFVAVHGLSDRDVGFSLSRAADRLDGLGYIATSAGDLLLSADYLGALPLAAAAALVLLTRPCERRLGLAVLAIGVASLLALAFVYLSGRAGIHYLVRTSAFRTIMTPTLLAATLLPLLVSRALGARRAQESQL